MTRVSERSNHNSLQHSLSRTKGKLEDLQLKGTTFKAINKPSDNPINTTEYLQMGTLQEDLKQFQKNSQFAYFVLNVTDKTLEEISDLAVRTKELALSLSSDFYDKNIRNTLVQEVRQIRDQMLALANKRVGDRYIFSGQKTLTAPFDVAGNYKGDKKITQLEISKDFFLPINISGYEIFVERPEKDQVQQTFISSSENFLEQPVEHTPKGDGLSVFKTLDLLISGLESDNTIAIQSTLDKLDAILDRVVTHRTKVGSQISVLENNLGRIESEQVEIESKRSLLMDADVLDLFSQIAKQQEILKAAYKTSQGLLNQNLLDFMRI